LFELFWRAKTQTKKTSKTNLLYKQTTLMQAFSSSSSQPQQQPPVKLNTPISQIVRPNPTTCATCKKPAQLLCTRCRAIHYCSAQCQGVDWKPNHKANCSPHPANVLVQELKNASDALQKISMEILNNNAQQPQQQPVKKLSASQSNEFNSLVSLLQKLSLNKSQHVTILHLQQVQRANTLFENGCANSINFMSLEAANKQKLIQKQKVQQQQQLAEIVLTEHALWKRYVKIVNDLVANMSLHVCYNSLIFQPMLHNLNQEEEQE